MFELGLRLAFDKPTIIVKDEKTSYSFDTSSIEHLEYPRDLRFARIVEFKRILGDKIKATYDRSLNDQNYTTFLKHFGEFKVAKIEKKEVSRQEFILDELRYIKSAIRKLDRGIGYPSSSNFRNRTTDFDVCLRNKSSEEIDKIIKAMEDYPAVNSVNIKEISSDHKHILMVLRKDHFVTRLDLSNIIGVDVKAINSPS